MLGHNGAGKTSLLRLIAGLSRPSSGSLKWHNVAADQAVSLSYIGHKPAVKGVLSVRQNLTDYAHLHGCYEDAVVERALQTFNLLSVADVLCMKISEGQCRKIALSRLLVGGSALWILDEPTASLDRAGITCLEKMLAQHMHSGGLAVIATHRELDIPDVQKQTLHLAATNGQAHRETSDVA